MYTPSAPRTALGRGAIIFLALLVVTGLVTTVSLIAPRGGLLHESTLVLFAPLLWPAVFVLPDEADELLGLPRVIAVSVVVSMPWWAFLSWLGARAWGVQANTSFERTRSARRSTP